MLSRDTRVQLTVVALALVGLAAMTQLPSDPAVTLVTLVCFNGTVLAGAHLYLAWRGEDGLVPAAARRRFVTAVAVVLSLGALPFVTDPVSIGPVSTDAVFAGVAGVVALAYLVVEARSGYRESLREEV